MKRAALVLVLLYGTILLFLTQTLPRLLSFGTTIKFKPIKAAIAIFIVLLPALFYAQSLYADDLRVTVSLFQSSPEDKELARSISIMIAKDIMGSGGLKFVSPTEFVGSIVGAEKMGGLKFESPEGEFSDKRMADIEKVIGRGFGFEIFEKLTATVDAIVTGSVKRNGDKIKAEFYVLDAKNPGHQDYSAAIECDDSQLEKEALRAIRPLLKYIQEGEKIYADILLNRNNSVVRYVVTSIDGRKLWIDTDFTGDRPHPELQAVVIATPENIDENGATIFKIKSQEGKIIDVTFNYKLGRVENILVDVPQPDPANSAEKSEKLTVKSDAGYVIDIDSTWKDNELKLVKIYPRANPFGGD